MRTCAFDSWPAKRSVWWPSLAGAVLLLGLSACGSGEPEPAVAEPAPAADATRRAPVDMVPLSPTGEVTLADGFTFAWELPAGSQGGTWRIMVFDGGTQPIWESPWMTYTEFEAPPGLLIKMQAGSAYTWRVAGGLDAGGRGRTPDTRILIR